MTDTTTTTTAPGEPTAGPDRFAHPIGRAGLRQAFASELTKIRTLRSTAWTLVTMAASTVAIAVLVAATASLQDNDTILSAALGNSVPGQLAAGAFGVLAVCSEYGTGTIRATFAANPRRLTVLAAKTLATATLVYIVALAAALCAYQTATMMLSGHDYPPGEPMPALLGVALSYATVAVLGVAMGTALRHTAGAVTAITSFLLLPTLLGPLLGGWQRWITGSSPVAALQKLTQTSDASTEVLGTLGGWPTLWLVCTYTVCALAASAVLLHSRDA